MMIQEDPVCEQGYPIEQLERLLTHDAFHDLGKVMYGRTVGICDGLVYDCGPHGKIIYVHDVRQFMEDRT